MSVATPLGVLFLLFLLETKHFICDGPLQTKPMIIEKSHYGKKLGLVHAGLHGLFSLGALLIAGPSARLGILLAVGEGIIHYHIDFSKENLVKKMGWTSLDRNYWWALAGDQALHHFTYLAMGAIAVSWV